MQAWSPSSRRAARHTRKFSEKIAESQHGASGGAQLASQAMAFALDDSLSLPVRQCLSYLVIAMKDERLTWKDERLELEKGIFSKEMTWKDDIVNLTRSNDRLQALLDDAMKNSASVNPRAIIEYVENFVMPAEYGAPKLKDREAKWERFFDDKSGNGPALLVKLQKDLPNQDSAAKCSIFIANLYAYVSGRIHATAYEIAANTTKVSHSTLYS